MEYNEIYNTVTKYYNIPKGNNDPESSPFDDGRVTITNIVDNNFMKISNKVGDVVKEIKLSFPEILAVKKGKQPVDTCYTIIFSISAMESENVIFSRELFCQISMLANYYCVYGKDTVTIHERDQTLYFDPIIIPSAENIYKHYYIGVRALIEKTFRDYAFMPFIFLQKRITGLKIFTTFLKENQYSSVYQALFTPENITDYKMIGDIVGSVS